MAQMRILTACLSRRVSLLGVQYESVPRFAAFGTNSSRYPQDFASGPSQLSKTNIIANQVRYMSASSPNASPVSIPLEDVPSNLRWDVVDELPAPEQVLTSPIIKFWDLNLFQEIVYPYTWAVMNYMDQLLNYMPWWCAIIATTVTIRLVFLPAYIMQHRIGIKSYNILPQTQAIQKKINEALTSGDQYHASVERSKLAALEKSHGLSIMNKLTPTLIQSPMFITMFLTMRRYAEEPIYSMTHGGAYWFQDLTLPDPYYILPVITSLSMWISFELGMEGSMNPSGTTLPAVRWFMRIFPGVLVFFTSTFPAAIVLFWSTNNMMTLILSRTINNRWVARKLDIPQRLKFDAQDLPLSNQSFTNQIKTAKNTAKAKNTTFDIRRLDDIAFRKAGLGPVQKTYKDPPKL